MAYTHWQDRFIAATGIPLPGRPYPCSRLGKLQVGGETTEVIDGVPTAECVRLTPSKRIQGFWRNDFEGSQFCFDTPSNCTYTRRPRIWFGYSEEKLPPTGGLYAVDFIGRQTLYRGGYGHMGMSDQEMVVDRMISVRKLDEVIVG